MLNHQQLINYNFSKAANSYTNNALVQKISATKLLNLLDLKSSCAGYILDLGSGAGTFGYFEPAIIDSKFSNSNLKIILYDLSLTMLRAANTYYPENYYQINGDANTLPFATNSMNLVISNFMLQWAQDKNIVLSEIYRVMKSGGIGVMSILVRPSFWQLQQSILSLSSMYDISKLELQLVSEYLRLINKVGLELLDSKQYEQTLYFNDIYQLLNHFKQTGTAMNKFSHFKGLGAKRFVSELSLAYSQYETNLGLPLNYTYLVTKFKKP